MTTCRGCRQPLPAGATKCPACLVVVQPTDEEVYELSASDTRLPEDWDGGATYALELPARCPHCRETISQVRVLRLKRTHVRFTSTLPRGGRVIVCAACQTILAADVSTL